MHSMLGLSASGPCHSGRHDAATTGPKDRDGFCHGQVANAKIGGQVMNNPLKW